MIAIFDYGAGNLRSVQNTLDQVGAPYKLARTPADLKHMAKIILPGVGHFGQMMRELARLDAMSALRERIEAGTPFLGICLGLQALFEESEEAPEVKGFGIFPGKVRRFNSDQRVPHMGWNALTPARQEARLLTRLGEHPYLYFAHSYYVPVVPATAATCTYGATYTAVLETDTIFGVQFHPEKSGPLGLQIVKNFVEL